MFTWTSPAGVQITLPEFDKAGGTALLRRHRRRDPVDMTFSILEEVADEETLAKIDALAPSSLDPLVEAWMDSTPGESLPSST